MIKQTLAEIDDRCGIQWRFDTPRYTVAFWAEEEGHLDPEYRFELPEDIKFARQGHPAHWFCAFVGVFKRDDHSADVQAGYPTDEDFDCIGYDTLGGCSYNSFKEFYSGHRQGGHGHYFPSMVRQALSEARAHELTLQHAYAA